MTPIKSLLESLLVPALQWFIEPLNRFLGQLPPPAWRLSVCVFMLAGTFWTCFLRREFVFRGSPSNAPWRDLRFWVPLLLIPYILVYLVF